MNECILLRDREGDRVDLQAFLSRIFLFILSIERSSWKTLDLLEDLPTQVLASVPHLKTRGKSLIGLQGDTGEWGSSRETGNTT